MSLDNRVSGLLIMSVAVTLLWLYDTNRLQGVWRILQDPNYHAGAVASNTAFSQPVGSATAQNSGNGSDIMNLATTIGGIFEGLGAIFL